MPRPFLRWEPLIRVSSKCNCQTSATHSGTSSRSRRGRRDAGDGRAVVLHGRRRWQSVSASHSRRQPYESPVTMCATSSGRADPGRKGGQGRRVRRAGGRDPDAGGGRARRRGFWPACMARCRASPRASTTWARSTRRRALMRLLWFRIGVSWRWRPQVRRLLPSARRRRHWRTPLDQSAQRPTVSGSANTKLPI